MSEEMDKNIYFDYDDTHIREDAKKRYILGTSRTDFSKFGGQSLKLLWTVLEKKTLKYLQIILMKQ